MEFDERGSGVTTLPSTRPDPVDGRLFVDRDSHGISAVLCTFQRASV